MAPDQVPDHGAGPGAGPCAAAHSAAQIHQVTLFKTCFSDRNDLKYCRGQFTVILYTISDKPLLIHNIKRTKVSSTFFAFELDRKHK